MQKVGKTQRPNIEPWEQDIPEGTPFVTTQAGNRYYDIDLQVAEDLDRQLDKIERGEGIFYTQEEMDRMFEDRKRVRALARQALEQDADRTSVPMMRTPVETGHAPSPIRQRVPYVIEEPELWVAAEPMVEYKTRQTKV